MELVKVSRVASWCPDMTTREVQDHLKLLHRRHGSVLFRKAMTVRAPYWVSLEALRAHWGSRFGVGAANPTDLAAVHARIDAVQATAERALEAAIGGSRSHR